MDPIDPSHPADRSNGGTAKGGEVPVSGDGIAYDFENLQVEIDDARIATVTIDRPEVLNALNDRTIVEIDRCFASLAEDPRAAVVIVTGAGEKAFVAGADIKELATQAPEEGRRRARAGQRALSRIEHLGKPVIAAIQGFALGGGCELALACHLRYLSNRARLGLPEVTLGIIPGYGGTQRLQRIVGRTRALQLILTGDMVGAGEAVAYGLANGVTPAEELMPTVRGVAETLVSRGPVALRYALDSVLRGGDVSLPEGLAIEADLFGLVSTTEDMKEGMQAFLEKRTANFRGQ